MTATATLSPATWVRTCRVDDILPWCGVAALLGGRQIAIVRWGDSQEVHALDNFDPFSKAMVISRGIVGDLAGQAVVASPIYKQHFRLRDGVCVEDPSIKLGCYPVRVVDGAIEVRVG